MADNLQPPWGDPAMGDLGFLPPKIRCIIWREVGRLSRESLDERHRKYSWEDGGPSSFLDQSISLSAPSPSGRLSNVRQYSCPVAKQHSRFGRRCCGKTSDGKLVKQLTERLEFGLVTAEEMRNFAPTLRSYIQTSSSA
ncbi:MAG: hypothetical protein MMC33_009948 [Icmadophila ericetorum]|nr:hypothetical protein [Icmadophila ericetorum]